MKLIYTTLLVLLSSLLSTFTMVSQTDNNSNPTDFGTTGETGSNPNDVPATPIDNYLNILFTVGISYVFFIIVTSKKK